MKKGSLLILSLAASFILCSCEAKDEKISLAFESLRDDDIPGAVSLLDEAEAEGEDAQLVARARGIICLEEDRYEDAIKYFEQAIALAEGHVTEVEFDTSYYLMTAQQKAGYLDDAIQTCSAILGLRPAESATWFMRGKLNLENGSYDDALRDFNRAVDTAEPGPDIYINIFEFLNSKGYKEAAGDYLARASAQNVKATDLQKGRLAYCRGDYETARDFLEKARAEDEEKVILYLGRTYEALNDYSFAASLYESYSEKHPEDMEIVGQLGLCYMALGEYEKALEAFENALGGVVGDMKDNLEFNRIVALENLGDFDRAKELSKEYSAAHPDDEAGKREKDFLTQWERMGGE